MPIHFSLTVVLLRKARLYSHSNSDLCTCEDIMLFSLVKMSCFRAKTHLGISRVYVYIMNKYIPVFNGQKLTLL